MVQTINIRGLSDWKNVNEYHVVFDYTLPQIVGGVVLSGKWETQSVIISIKDGHIEVLSHIDPLVDLHKLLKAVLKELKAFGKQVRQDAITESRLDN